MKSHAFVFIQLIKLRDGNADGQMKKLWGIAMFGGTTTIP